MAGKRTPNWRVQGTKGGPTITLRLQTPGLPNFIRDSEGRCWPVGQFDADTLRALGERYTEALVARAAKRGAR